MDQNRALLFPDWELEKIVKHMHSDRDDELSGLVNLVNSGKLAEASKWLQIEISHYPWVLLIAAHISVANGKLEEAGKLLRAVTLIAHDTLVQLWAWHNLTKIGKFPSVSFAQQVMGIIIEVPFENSAEIVASYSDGTARYINHKGGMIIWEDYDETITPLIFSGLKMARPMGSPVSQHADSPVEDGNVRLTLLCPGGIYIWEGIPEDGSDVARLFAQQAGLLNALVRKTLESREGPDGQ